MWKGSSAAVPAAPWASGTLALLGQIEATDGEIDRLVYDLYGLTAEEIAVVEGHSEPRPQGSGGKAVKSDK